MGRNTLRTGYNPSGSRVGANASGDSGIYENSDEH